MTIIVWNIGTNKMKERSKTSNLIVDHFSLTFINLSLAWMLSFHIWFQNKGKSLVWSEYYNQFGINQHSCVSPHLRTTASQLSNPQKYGEPFQISKMKFFCENSQWLKVVNFFIKYFILDVWLDSEYASVICYSLFGKTEDANKIDSVAM